MGGKQDCRFVCLLSAITTYPGKRDQGLGKFINSRWTSQGQGEVKNHELPDRGYHADTGSPQLPPEAAETPKPAPAIKEEAGEGGDSAGRDAHSQQPDGSMLIGPLSARDSGWLMCVASNSRERDHRYILLTVAEDARSPVPPQEDHSIQQGGGGFVSGHPIETGPQNTPSQALHPVPRPAHHSTHRLSIDKSGPSTVEGRPGQTVRLPCKVPPSPGVTVEWRRDGRPLSSPRHSQQPDGSMLIGQLSARDSGWLMCVASNSRERDHRYILLTVAEDARSPVPPQEDHSIQQGGGGFVSGHPIETGPQNTPSQALHPVPRPAHHSTHRLSIDKSGPSTVEGRPGQTVRLPCKVPPSPGVTVEWRRDGHPLSSPRLSIDKSGPSTVEGRPGQTVRLPCKVPPSPGVTVEWRRDGHPLSSPRHTQQADGSLIISELSSEDPGHYTCIASNARERDHRQLQLKVQGELKITTAPNNVQVSEGSSTQLPCIVTGSNVNVRWSRNGVPVRSDGRHVLVSQDGSLILNNVQRVDEGSYTCNAYMGSHSVSASAEVRVIKNTPQGQHTQQADGSLIISELSSEDPGHYTCIASNARERDHRQLQLKVQGEERARSDLPAATQPLTQQQLMKEHYKSSAISMPCSFCGIPNPAMM
ncbi:UNVERIFIED_CONTAM: hypothetical protein FKN15_035465 [Acipenser sinensis]